MMNPLCRGEIEEQLREFGLHTEVLVV